MLGNDLVRCVPSGNSKGCICADAPLPGGANSDAQQILAEVLTPMGIVTFKVRMAVIL